MSNCINANAIKNLHCSWYSNFFFKLHSTKGVQFWDNFQLYHSYTLIPNWIFAFMHYLYWSKFSTRPWWLYFYCLFLILLNSYMHYSCPGVSCGSFGYSSVSIIFTFSNFLNTGHCDKYFEKFQFRIITDKYFEQSILLLTTMFFQTFFSVSIKYLLQSSVFIRRNTQNTLSIRD